MNFTAQVLAMISSVDYSGLYEGIISDGMNSVETTLTPDILYNIRRVMDALESQARYTVNGLAGLIYDVSSWT